MAGERKTAELEKIMSGSPLLELAKLYVTTTNRADLCGIAKNLGIKVKYNDQTVSDAMIIKAIVEKRSSMTSNKDVARMIIG